MRLLSNISPRSMIFSYFVVFFVLKITITVLCMVKAFIRQEDNNMEQQKVIDEIEYFKAQKLTDQLYENGLLSFVEYDKLTELNRRSFSPLFADLLPKVLDKSLKKR